MGFNFEFGVRSGPTPTFSPALIPHLRPDDLTVSWRRDRPASPPLPPPLAPPVAVAVFRRPSHSPRGFTAVCGLWYNTNHHYFLWNVELLLLLFVLIWRFGDFAFGPSMCCCSLLVCDARKSIRMILLAFCSPSALCGLGDDSARCSVLWQGFGYFVCGEDTLLLWSALRACDVNVYVLCKGFCSS